MVSYFGRNKSGAGICADSQALFNSEHVSHGTDLYGSIARPLECWQKKGLRTCYKNTLVTERRLEKRPKNSQFSI